MRVLKPSNGEASAIAEVAGSGKGTTVYTGDVGIGDILDDMIANSPEPTGLGDQIIAEMGAPSGAAKGFNDSAIITDRSGAAFDPSVYESEPDGSPRLSSDGLFRRKRGRKPGSTATSIVRPEDGEVKEGAIITRAEATKHARETVGLIVTLGQSFFGDAFTPLSKAENSGIDEREYMTEKWADLYEVRGAVKLPPELSVLICLAGYVAPRLQKPEVQERALGFWGKAKKMLGFGGAELDAA